MKTRVEKKVIENEVEIYIANDGKEFDDKKTCENYEKTLKHLEKGKLADSMKIEELDEQVPINCSDMNENNRFTWYKVNTKEDFMILDDACKNALTHPQSYPEVICVETCGYELYASDAYDYHLTDMMKVTKEFWEKLGYDIDIKEKV